ncbi:hypothetical protein Q8W71_04135 [Methylobacterium sp. NEAU 140]|uniref:hypothetical protein n=1 Tax=Methylobacterium sp. NEAU 140 TaxID=3064945 RepID=UPI002733F988|nr:hypothetical protein [Methylobacterium sp. NEAU 140]MDP4021806.1 hypothetical protein [Methylobacterium sp. NEAU 140]
MTGDSKRPETDPAEAPTGGRAYEDRPVRGVPQGGDSPGATEPADIGGSDRGTEPPPRERPRDDGPGYRG